MTIRPTFRRIVLTLPGSTIKPSTIPLTLPAPEDRLSPADCDLALRQGFVPLPVQHGHLAPIFSKHHHLARLEVDYRAHLRHAISKGRWTPDASVHDQLIWGYLRRAVEYEARKELKTLSTLYRKSASATDNLRHKLEADGRLYEGIPLPVAKESNQSAFDAHWAAIEAARQAAKAVASRSLDTLVWNEWLDWLYEKGAWEIVGEEQEASRWRYRPERLSIADLEHLAHVFHKVGDLAHWLVSTVTVAAMKRPKKGGHPIDYPMKWLIGEARRQGMDVAALGKLLYEHRDDIANFTRLGKSTLNDRVKAAWGRVPQSDPSLQTPPVAHNL